MQSPLRLSIFVLSALAFGFALSSWAQSEKTVAIVGGKVIDGTSGAPIANGVVIVEGNTIRAVGSRSDVSIPPGARTIDASGNSVLPALADLHTHSAHYTVSVNWETDAMAALRAAGILRQALGAGITLVRDAGARNLTAIALKRAIEEGYIEGPRLIICNQIVSATGGHGSEGDRMVKPKWVLEGDSLDEWRRNIRQNFKMGADYVKVTYPFTPAEIELAVEEARHFGARIAVDAVGPPYVGMMMVEWAVRAGADTIEHLAPMKNQAEVIALMKEQGTIVVPTLHAMRRFAGERWEAPTEREVKNLKRPEDYEARFRAMHGAGVPMAIGTDAGGKDQGEIGLFYTEEIKRFLSWGYSAAEVIQAATRIGAEAAGLGDHLGTLEVGKWADIIIVTGDALEDPTRLPKPILVMKDGEIVRDLMETPAVGGTR